MNMTYNSTTGESVDDVVYLYFYFFFQAEDGIRDHCVTGVQTCALPISRPRTASRRLRADVGDVARSHAEGHAAPIALVGDQPLRSSSGLRSEERRVGKECR